MTEAEAITLRSQCLEDGRWRFAVSRRLRQVMVDAAVREATADWSNAWRPPSIRQMRVLLRLEAEFAAQQAGYGSIAISIALWLFTTFILPRIIERWRDGRVAS